MTEPVLASSHAARPLVDDSAAALMEGGAIHQPPAAGSSASTPPPSSSPAITQLVRAVSLLPQVSPECTERAADLAKGAGALVAATGMLIAGGTAGPVGAFIGASMIFGAVLARYHNCETEAAESKTKTK